MTVPGVVLDAADLALPGGLDELVLAPISRTALDEIRARCPAGPGSDAAYDEDAVDAAVLASAALSPVLNERQACALLGAWTEGDARTVLDYCLRDARDASVEQARHRLHADTALQAEMDVCARLGISRSHFLGGPDLWTAQDRALALAWRLREKATCHRCGTRPDQWATDPQAFDVDGYDCPGCYLISRAEKSIREQDADALAHIHLFLVPADSDDGEG